MSLRARLLVTIGVIAVVALVIADLVTYSALQSFLYQRVDQQLTSAHGGYEHRIDQGLAIPCLGGPNEPLPAAGPGGNGTVPEGGPSNVFQSQAVQVRTASGALVGGSGCPSYVDGTAYTPAITTPITGFSAAPDGTQAAFFDAPSAQADGPTFRVRASTLANGDMLIVAQPLGDTESTLHRLLVVELLVTAGAVVVALAAGLWLVRIGLKPLARHGDHRRVHRRGQPDRAGAGGEREDRGRPAGPDVQHHADAHRGGIRCPGGVRTAPARVGARLRRFVADASHELRTPIAAVLAYAELFGRGASEQKEDLERLMRGIRAETGRMEHLVADLLLLARLDEGRPMEAQAVDVVALCAEAVQTARPSVRPGRCGSGHPAGRGGRGTPPVCARWSTTCSATSGPTPRPAPPPGLRVEPRATGAVIEVADGGPGMTDEQAAHVFERFYRADPSRSRLHGGAGLGLSIVAAIVAAHGGTVTARSVEGRGTTFTVRLPLAPVPTALPTGEPPVVGRGPGPVSPDEA